MPALWPWCPMRFTVISKIQNPSAIWTIRVQSPAGNRLCFLLRLIFWILQEKNGLTAAK